MPATYPQAPPAGTKQRWCWDLIHATDLAGKLHPPEDEVAAGWESNAPPRRIPAPGRPPEWTIVARHKRSRSLGTLERPEQRARLAHRFFHHEVQATELFAWAVLAFPETPEEFREGLLGLVREEIVHARLYAEHLERLGHQVGDFEVRDWFWQRGGECADPTAFVSFIGLGLEGANLDHNARLAPLVRAAGDNFGAEVLERIAEEEVGHVRFAIRWFEHFTGAPLDYDTWCHSLPEPLTPSLFQGDPINRSARRLAGLPEEFVDRLAAEPPATERRVR